MRICSGPGSQTILGHFPVIPPDTEMVKITILELEELLDSHHVKHSKFQNTDVKSCQILDHSTQN